MLTTDETGLWVYGFCLYTFVNGSSFTHKKSTNHKQNSAHISQRLKPDGSAPGSPRTSGGSSLRFWGKWRMVFIMRSRSSRRRMSPTLGCCHSVFTHYRNLLIGVGGEYYTVHAVAKGNWNFPLLSDRQNLYRPPPRPYEVIANPLFAFATGRLGDSEIWRRL